MDTNQSCKWVSDPWVNGSMGHVFAMGQWVMGHMPWVMTHQYFDSLII